MKNIYNVEVKLKPGEEQERFIKRFFKKVKKLGIIEEYTDKVSFYKKPSVKKKEKIIKHRFTMIKEGRK
jgi:ribosomal protein S21